MIHAAQRLEPHVGVENQEPEVMRPAEIADQNPQAFARRLYTAFAARDPTTNEHTLIPAATLQEFVEGLQPLLADRMRSALPNPIRQLVDLCAAAHPDTIPMRRLTERYLDAYLRLGWPQTQVSRRMMMQELLRTLEAFFTGHPPHIMDLSSVDARLLQLPLLDPYFHMDLWERQTDPVWTTLNTGLRMSISSPIHGGEASGAVRWLRQALRQLDHSWLARKLVDVRGAIEGATAAVCASCRRISDTLSSRFLGAAQRQAIENGG